MRNIITFENLSKFAEGVNTIIPALNAAECCGVVYYDTDPYEQCSLIIDYTEEEYVNAMEIIDEIAQQQFRLSSGLELILQIRDMYQMRRVAVPGTKEYDYSNGVKCLICTHILSTVADADKSSIEQRWELIRQEDLDWESFYSVISDGSRWGDYEANADDVAASLTTIYLRGDYPLNKYRKNKVRFSLTLFFILIPTKTSQ